MFLFFTNYDRDRSPRFGELIAFDRAWVVLDIFYLPPLTAYLRVFPPPSSSLLFGSLVLSPSVR